VFTGNNGGTYLSGFDVGIGGQTHKTGEVLQDDGTYGDSMDYLYWFDAKGVYHQHYKGNEILHISEHPIATKSIVLNLETDTAGK
jgi:hypothetical protein